MLAVSYMFWWLCFSFYWFLSGAAMEVRPVVHAGLTIRVADVYHYPTRIVRHGAIRESEVHSFSVDHVNAGKILQLIL
ncbi:unnamed protein product [Urochloa humidicola]